MRSTWSRVIPTSAGSTSVPTAVTSSRFRGIRMRRSGSGTSGRRGIGTSGMPAASQGKPAGMDEIDQEGPSEGITSPDQPTHEATTPPGNPEPDEEALRRAEEELEKPGGGH